LFLRGFLFPLRHFRRVIGNDSLTVVGYADPATGMKKKLAPVRLPGLLRGLDRNDPQPPSSPRSLAFPRGEGLDVPSLGDEPILKPRLACPAGVFYFPA